ncbi:MAG: T9SS type A sorting domain-containing protein [Bacteroidales bacterium]|nr:T9SS type A sorting domain-containing protein [Bacteroidales bacterium]
MKKHYKKLWLYLALIPGILMAQLPEDPSILNRNSAEYIEAHGLGSEKPVTDNVIATTRDFLNKEIPAEGIILIPNSATNSVMALDPETGELIDAAFIPADDVNLSTPIEILFNGSTYFISDQLKKLVQEYDMDGIFLGTFAPEGGENTSILNNIRGIHLRENGNLLVTVAGATNAHSVAEFNGEGEYLGNFIANEAGGLNGPWDILYRPDFNDYLVSANGSSGIHRYDHEGEFIEMFVSGLAFPEQMQLLANGNILVANFSGAQGLFEYDSQGNQVGYYNVVTGLRGVHELPDGNILVTNSAGVHKINRQNQNLGLMASGNARFITLVKPMSSFIVNLRDDFNILINETASLGEDLEIVGGEEPFTYLWTLQNSDWTSTEENPSYTFDEEGTFVFTLLVTDNEEETGSAQLTVFVYPELTADAGDDMYAQTGHMVTLGGETVAQGGMPPHNYHWTLDDSDWSSDDSNPEVSFENKGSYHFTLLVTDSEGNTAGDDITLIVFDELQADAGDDQTVLPNNEFTLGGDPSASEGIEPYTYNWTLAGSDWTSNEPNPTVVLQVPGGYQFTLQVTDAIDNTAFAQVNISVLDDTSVDELASEKIKLFPNPASDYIRIEFPENFSGNIIIVDISGREVFKEKSTGKYFEIQTGNWPAGTYILKAGELEHKFIIQR